MANISKEKILFYLLIVNLTDFERATQTSINCLVLKVTGTIDKVFSSKIELNKFLGRVLFSYYDTLKETEVVNISPDVSEEIKPQLRNQVLSYEISKARDQITINRVYSARNQSFLANPILLKKE